MDFKITNIKKHHKDKIYKLIEEINQEDNLSYSLTEEWLDFVIENNSEAIFLAFLEERLVGLATAMINSTYKEQGTLNVIVAPKFRNNGLGSALYNKAYDFAKKKNVKVLEAYIKQRLTPGVEFAKNRNFQTILYSWEMELDLQDANFTLDNFSEYNLRKARQEDGLNYNKIIKDAFGDEVGADELKQALSDPSINVYFLENEKQIIGSATIQIRKDLSLAYIYDIAILKEYGGQGLGSYLLKSCIMTLKEENLDKASLLVTGDNKKALELYKKIGFKEIDIDLVMTKNINKFVVERSLL